jgi:mono/diheme cytochrome c family protein
MPGHFAFPSVRLLPVQIVSLRGYALVAVLLALVLAGCGGNGEEAATTAPTQQATETAAGGATGDAAAGEAVFADAGCGSCHALAAAGSQGTVGPDLDELQPDFEAVVEQVTNGGGGMPAFGGSLSEQQIRDVAAYVVQSTRG